MMSKRTKILIFVLVLVCVVLMVCYLCRGSGTVKGSSKPVTRRPGEAAAVDTSKVAKEEEEQVAWMELPASSSTGDDRCVITHTAQMEGRSQRNYTILYDDDLYAALWVAYPLCASHTSSGREETWGYDPKLSKSAQTSVKKGYGASEPTVNYPKNFYARGHQIPNADRNAVPQMQEQTYYATNLVPQIQDKFNGGIWNNLESAVRNAIPASDTLYVTTGVTFKTVGGNETVTTIQPQHDTKKCPVPNYFYKVLLKVKRNSNGEVTSASTIGFWFEHRQYDDKYNNYAVSVDEIEELTGFDFFVNLPDTIENTAEKNSNWTNFQNF